MKGFAIYCTLKQEVATSMSDKMPGTHCSRKPGLVATYQVSNGASLSLSQKVAISFSAFKFRHFLYGSFSERFRSVFGPFRTIFVPFCTIFTSFVLFFGAAVVATIVFAAVVAVIAVVAVAVAVVGRRR